MYYTGALIVYVIYTAFVSLRKIKQEDRLQRTEMMLLEADANLRYSKACLSLFEFSLRHKTECSQAAETAASYFALLKSEDERADVIRTRPRAEKVMLVVRRVFANAVVVLLTLLAWFLIVFMTLLQNAFSNAEYAASYTPFVRTLASLATTLSMAAINSLAPIVISTMHDLEKWDDPAFRIKKLVVSLYILKILNLAVLMVTYLGLMWNTFGSLLGYFAVQKVNTIACVEDQTGQQFITLVAIDFLVGRIGGLAGILGVRLLAHLLYVLVGWLADGV